MEFRDNRGKFSFPGGTQNRHSKSGTFPGVSGRLAPMWFPVGSHACSLIHGMYCMQKYTQVQLYIFIILCFADIIAGPPKEIPVPFGSSVDICVAAVNYCDCTLVIVDGSNEHGHCDHYDEFLLATYTKTNVTEDHTVEFVFMCNGSTEHSSLAKITVKGQLQGT